MVEQRPACGPEALDRQEEGQGRPRLTDDHVCQLKVSALGAQKRGQDST